MLCDPISTHHVRTDMFWHDRMPVIKLFACIIILLTIPCCEVGDRITTSVYNIPQQQGQHCWRTNCHIYQCGWWCYKINTFQPVNRIVFEREEGKCTTRWPWLLVLFSSSHYLLLCSLCNITNCNNSASVCVAMYGTFLPDSQATIVALL